MPLFEYICRQCGHISELLVGGSRRPVCPHCGSRKLDKQLSAFSPPPASSPRSPVPPCGSGSCPARGMGCAGGGCPHSH